MEQLKTQKALKANPTGKEVVLFAPKYSHLAISSAEKEGFKVAKTKEELFSIIQNIRKDK